jgi:hypothetical protein
MEQQRPRATKKGGTESVESLLGLGANSAEIVLRAAEALEEPFRQGISAAQKVQRQVFKSSELPPASTDPLVARLQEDLNMVVAMFCDMVLAMSRQMAQMSGNLGATPKGGPAAGAPTVLTVGPVEPGKSASVSMSLENNCDAPSAPMKPYCTELVGHNGARIPASGVLFKPATFAIGPQEKTDVSLTVKIPKGTPPGQYAGLVVLSGPGNVTARLVANVVKSAK